MSERPSTLAELRRDIIAASIMLGVHAGRVRAGHAAALN
jgi:hypothetical protein